MTGEKMKNIQLINSDITEEFFEICAVNGYVCVDTETTGLDYRTAALCTIQLYCNEYAIIIQFETQKNYEILRELMLSDEITKVFHNAVFDVSFLMKNLELDYFGKLACTKISAKLIHGLEHKNSLKNLLKEYLKIEIDKSQQLSDWTVDELTEEQKHYAINDVKYLYELWIELEKKLYEKKIYKLAIKCFEFVPNYTKLTDKNIDNIFAY